jgi:DmsE family decaheme c-type cytochrome
MVRQGRLRVVQAPLVLFILLMAVPSLAASPPYSREVMINKSGECLDCHQDAADNLKGSKHQLTIVDDKLGRIAVGCIGCHAGWEQHLENPSKENITVPANLLVDKQAKVCSGCHLSEHQANMITSDPHGRAQLNCSSCHTVHGNKAKYLVKDEREEFCASCHTDVMAQFQSRSAHPLVTGNIHCSSCHFPDDRKDPTLARGIDWTCQNCHSEFAGPHAFEHPVTETYLFNGGGCTECHNPHGSPNDRLLRQPRNGVCLQCHGIPPLHLTEHAGLGAKVDCVNCHTDIHGSDDNSKFLDPQLNTKFFADCYQSGCHDTVRPGGAR